MSYDEEELITVYDSLLIDHQSVRVLLFVGIIICIIQILIQNVPVHTRTRTRTRTHVQSTKNH